VKQRNRRPFSCSSRMKKCAAVGSYLPGSNSAASVQNALGLF
jgi:hypothetical protein